MTNLTIDASALIAVVANEPSKKRIVDAADGVSLIAPRSIHWEIGNAFSAMLKRGRTNIEKATQAIQIYEQIPIRFVDVKLTKSLSIAHDLDIYAYDAYLLQCAITYKSPLLTLDAGLIHAAKKLNIQVVEVIE